MNRKYATKITLMKNNPGVKMKPQTRFELVLFILWVVVIVLMILIKFQILKLG
jgi:hypothetical protein